MNHAECWQRAFCIAWLALWGFVFCKFPAPMVRIGFSSVTPKRVRLVRIIGIVAITLALIAFPVELYRLAIDCL
jgi:hypothetical protein